MLLVIHKSRTKISHLIRKESDHNPCVHVLCMYTRMHMRVNINVNWSLLSTTSKFPTLLLLIAGLQTADVAALMKRSGSRSESRPLPEPFVTYWYSMSSERRRAKMPRFPRQKLASALSCSNCRAAKVLLVRSVSSSNCQVLCREKNIKSLVPN